MQPNRYQRLLSYLSDVHFETLESDYNEWLSVVLSRNRFQLLTPNAIYSYGDLYSNFSKAFRALPLSANAPDEVLLLGFGLGSIPYMIEKRWEMLPRYTAVEIDDTVIYLAHKYVTQYLKSAISLVQADAYAFVVQDEGQYDLICMDVFVDDEVPPIFESEDFLVSLRERLTPDGILLYNRLYLTPADKSATERFFRRDFKSVFPDGDFLDVGGNWMLCNQKWQK